MKVITETGCYTKFDIYVFLNVKYKNTTIKFDVILWFCEWFCLFIYLWVLTFPLLDCSEFGNFVITLICHEIGIHCVRFKSNMIPAEQPGIKHYSS